jgi:hypothetical protein
MTRRSVLLGSLAVPVLAACRTLDIEETATAVGVVETVDPRSREILLRGAAGAQSGALLSMVVGQRVRNLDQIRPGDRVAARYYQAIAAQVARPRSGPNEPLAGLAVARTPTAERPGGEVTRVLSGRVTVTAVDPASNAVSFVGPNGVPRTVVARRPEAQAFVRSLRPGEQVDIVYEEALAVSIEPMGRAAGDPTAPARSKEGPDPAVALAMR